MRSKIHIVIFATLMLNAIALQGQTLTLHFEEASLRNVLDEIENQSGLIFSYSNKLFDDQKIVSIHETDEPLSSVMEDIFPDGDIAYVIIEKQIVLKRVNPQKKNIKDNDKTTTQVKEVSYTVNGYVRDENSGEVLIGATIAVPGYSMGTTSNNYGFYSITLNSKYDTLSCTFIGYHTQMKTISTDDQSIDFLLNEKLQSISEVTIIAEEENEPLRAVRSSEQKLKSKSVRQMPALFGEKDVIKSLAFIPGIKFFGDGSTIFYVRGGSRDQNLIRVDEAPIYNPTHLMGFFSTIVPEAVKDIQVYKGDFPANYGGRLSSLIDIRTKDGNMQEFSMDGSVGFLSSRLSIQGPVFKNRVSYFISGRRSYIYKPIQAIENSIKDIHFADFHFKLNYIMNRSNRFFFSLYNSEDNFEQAEGPLRTSGINWKNTATTFRWNHLFSDRLFSNTTIYASLYDYFLVNNIDMGNYWNSHIDNFSLKTDFTYYLSPENTVRFGAKLAQHFMNPGNYYQENKLLSLPFEISTRSSNEAVLYFSNQLIFQDKLSLRIGARLTSWSNVGPSVEYFFTDTRLDSAHYAAGEVYHNYPTFDPRISLAYAPTKYTKLRFSYSKTSQFEQLITNSISPFSTLEVWLPAGPRIKPQRADQLTIGYIRNINNRRLKFDAEVYFKHMKNQVDYRDHAKLIMNPFIENELLFGDGIAYGFETILSKSEGRLNGWISYTLSKSTLKIDQINNGNAYPSYGDRPHDFSLYLSYSISDRLDCSVNFTYMTGAPFTAPTAFYNMENIQVPVYFARNNDRLPDYHRMDLSLNWNLLKKPGKFKHELIFSAYNLYGRKNPVAIHFNKIIDESGNPVIPYNYYSQPKLTATQFYIYGYLPSMTYRFGF